MNALEHRSALIVGAGTGLSASLARAFTKAGMKVALAARSTPKLGELAQETNAKVFECDATDCDEVKAMFGLLDHSIGAPDVVVYNAAHRTRGALVDLDPSEVAKSIVVSAFGGFLVAQAAARRMLPRSHGTILFTGATASVKGYPLSAPFAMGKFALRGLAQCLARELAPQGIHVAHIVIDGVIKSARHMEPPDKPESFLDPDAVAQTYLQLIAQPRSAWTWEVELRPWVEKF
jgi:NAD(P)-dependent dehydrogenase (short-subunit alcohol dehydrogenase family)